MPPALASSGTARPARKPYGAGLIGPERPAHFQVPLVPGSVSTETKRIPPGQVVPWTLNCADETLDMLLAS